MQKFPYILILWTRNGTYEKQKKELSEREYTSIGSGQYPVTLGIKKLEQKACWTKITVLLRYGE